MAPPIPSSGSGTPAATLLALLAAIVGRRLRWPAAVHLLWLTVLLRMVAPPLLAVPLLPASEAPTAGLVAVSGSMLGPAAGSVGPTLDPHLLLIVIWSAGAVAVLAVAVIRTRQLRHLLGRPVAAPAPLVERVEELAHRLKLRPPRTLTAE